MFSDRLINLALRGAGISDPVLAAIMAQIFSDGRKSFRIGVQLKATLRNFRSEHRELAMRTGMDKDVAKINAECLEHIFTQKTAFENVHRKHPMLFSDTRRVINFDETDIDSLKIRKVKRYCSSKTSKTPTVAGDFQKGGTWHVTNVVAVSADGHAFRPFLIVGGGMKVMSSWTDPLAPNPKSVVIQ